MWARLSQLPFLLILMAIGAVAMLAPAIHAYQIRDLYVARVFLYGSLLFLILFSLLAVAFARHDIRYPVRAHLAALVGAFTLLPLMLAVPLHEATGNVRFSDAWFEMISAITTTGATLFDGQGRLPPSVHLWRAIVAWLGGFLMWVAAAAILAPLNLGGFEVVSTGESGNAARPANRFDVRLQDTGERLRRFTLDFAPIYGGLTLFLWILLVLTGMQPMEGAVRAMSTLSTSGIVAGPGGTEGFWPELCVFVFLLLALSRLTFTPQASGGGWRALGSDPEMRLGLLLVIAVPSILFLRHFFAAFDTVDTDETVQAVRALWGALFTTLSFVTTTGFESADFDAARDWSGLKTPGLVLLGLSLVGGGVATTAGGVKLLRIYALYQHGQREMERLVHPSSVGASGRAGRRLRRQGAYVAWIFFMLFAMSIALVMAALSLTGVAFDDATILAIAALSTTGPLAQAAADPPLLYSSLSDGARIVFAAAMVLGRLETLALIALLNPQLWRG